MDSFLVGPREGQTSSFCSSLFCSITAPRSFLHSTQELITNYVAHSRRTFNNPKTVGIGSDLLHSLSLEVDKLTKDIIYARWLFKVLRTLCWLPAKLSEIVSGIKGGLLLFISCFSILAVTVVGLWGLLSLSSVLISWFVCLFNLTLDISNFFKHTA